ncbi:MAG: DUF1211 domain-containing protein [Alphaproteobacteria bacterium]|nr:DUF1211 domain-containing protein [Alphaproteobacteria bacterium]
MRKERLEAFSDGVIAIIITIMVLGLKPPVSASWAGLRGGIMPEFVSYILSFVYVAIYWNNHHHLLHTVQRINGKMLWANMHLLFWLSLIPFTTAWVRQSFFAATPTALYGVVLFLCATAYFLLQKTILDAQGKDSLLQKALGRDVKGKASAILYATGVVLAFRSPLVSNLIYAVVAAMWLVPDRRIEKIL